MNTTHSTAVMNIEAADSLNFRVIHPVESLRPWVDLYYSMLRPHAEYAGRCRNLYPDGGATLQFDFAHPHGVSATFNLQHHRQRRYFDRPLDCVAVRFKPGGAFALLGLSASELTSADAHSLMIKTGLNPLYEQLAESRCYSTRLRLIERFLIHLAQVRETRTGLVQHWLDTLPAAPAEIRQQLQCKGISRRRLERAFRLQTGFSPGQLYNLQRMKRIRNLLVRQPQLSLTAIAQQFGFYDQAHFIHQFTAATGTSPGDYRQRKLSQFYNRNQVNPDRLRPCTETKYTGADHETRR